MCRVGDTTLISHSRAKPTTCKFQAKALGPLSGEQTTTGLSSPEKREQILRYKKLRGVKPQRKYLMWESTLWLSPEPGKKVPVKMGSTEGTLLRTKMKPVPAFHQPRVPTFHY